MKLFVLLACMGDSDSFRNWISLEHRYYEKLTVYSSLKWSLSSSDISCSVVACAPCCGPVAVVPDSGWGISSALLIYAVSGSQIARFDTLRHSSEVPVRVAGLGWIDFDELLVVFQDGYFVQVSISAAVSEKSRVGELRPFSSCADEDQPEEICDVFASAESYVVVRDIAGHFYFVSRDNRSPKKLGGLVPPPERTISDDKSNLCGFVSKFWSGSDSSSNVEVLAIGSDGYLFRVTGRDTALASRAYSFRSIVSCPDGNFIACMLSNGGVVVQNFNSLATVAHFKLEQISLSLPIADDFNGPITIGWVGPDAVVLVCSQSLLLAGPGGGVVSLGHTSHSNDGMILATERDGLRLCHSGGVEFIRLIPENVVSVYMRPDSPGFKLLRAASASSASFAAESGNAVVHEVNCSLDCFKGNALDAYKHICELRSKGVLSEAVQVCASVAYFEWIPERQKRLMHAVAYGNRYASVLEMQTRKEEPTASDSLSVGQIAVPDRSIYDAPVVLSVLRVLNAIRSRRVGIPVTTEQLNELGFGNLIRRLSEYSLHLLALRVAAFCALSPNDALTGWILDALQTKDPDDLIAEKIIACFEFVRTAFKDIGRGAYSLPYISAAEYANAAGRRRCAEILLRRESNPALKIPIYLDMGQYSLALVAAMASNDSDVVLNAVEVLRRHLSLRDISQLFKTLPISMSHRATDLLAGHMRQLGETENVCALLVEAGRYREAAMELVSSVDETAEGPARIIALERAYTTIGRWSHKRVNAFELQALHHSILAAYNARDLERKCGVSTDELKGASSTALLSAASKIMDPHKRREALVRLRKDLKIPERRYFWVVLEASVSIGDMDAVEELSKSAGRGRPPPIGFMSFVDICMQHGHEEEAVKYALRIVDLRDRARALALCGRGKEAADIALKLRSQQLMQEVEALVARHIAQVPLTTSRP